MNVSAHCCENVIAIKNSWDRLNLQNKDFLNHENAKSGIAKVVVYLFHWEFAGVSRELGQI